MTTSWRLSQGRSEQGTEDPCCAQEALAELHFLVLPCVGKDTLMA